MNRAAPFYYGSSRLRAILILALTLTTGVFPDSVCFSADGPSKRRRELSGWERKLLKKDRRERIAPVTPSGGITTGLIIAFGHPLRPPYKLEYRGSNLFANGIQIQPSPFSLREHERASREYGDERRARDRVAAEVRKSIDSMYAGGKTQQQILEFIGTRKDVIAEARWSSDRSLEFRYQGETRFTSGMEFPDRGGRVQSVPNRQQQKVDAKLGRITELETHLREGRCLLFQSDNGTAFIQDPRSDVLELMTKSGVGDDEKLQNLVVLLGDNLIGALDVIANFDPSEWESKK